MNYELIINSSPNEVVIALMDDKKLVELHRESGDGDFQVGDVYLGKVKRVMPGLNAAFVDVGYEKDAFLHYLDLGPQATTLNKFTKQVMEKKITTSNLMYTKLDADIPKDGKIGNLLSSNQQILIQIAKEPISTKGPRITSEISLAGRYLVLVPFSERVSVSSRIRSQEEKNRLKRLIQSIKPKNFGVIIRTVAEDKPVAELDADMKDLLAKWEKCFEGLKTAKAPFRVLGEMNRSSALLRDVLNESFSNIYVNDEKLLQELKTYLQSIAPEKEKIAKLYKGSTPIFDHFGVDKQIKALFGKNVTMRNGGYLIIEHTEAMHVFDVNSGNRAKGSETQENNALETNLEAADEVARQLKLRDMGGIIVVDFIDMHNPENRKKLFDRMKEVMKKDKAKHNILPPTKFGLIQITRERVRPQMNVVTQEKCPACGGSGEVTPSILLVDQIENDMKYILKDMNLKGITLCVHPYLEAYLTKGLYSIQQRWFFKYKKKVKIRPVSSYHFLEFHFLSKDEDEIVLKS